MSKAEFDEREFHPKGTVLFVSLFVLLLIILWGTVYAILLARGATAL
jgi:hypothetical protein